MLFNFPVPFIQIFEEFTSDYDDHIEIVSSVKYHRPAARVVFVYLFQLAPSFEIFTTEHFWDIHLLESKFADTAAKLVD